MKTHMIPTTYLLLGLLGVLVLGTAVHTYTTSVVNSELEKASLALTAHIAEQEVVLSNIANLTRQNGADEITERIVVDCSVTERQRFDTLLGQLSGSISRVELSELDNLFFKCARFYADRKSVMASRLAREVSVYRDYIRLQTTVAVTDREIDNRVMRWQQISENELTLAADFNRLVELQRDIIVSLLAGKSHSSPEITATLSEVATLRDRMTVLTKQTENARAELLTL